MKKMLTLMALVVVLCMVAGCGKSDEDKAKDAAEKKATELKDAAGDMLEK